MACPVCDHSSSRRIVTRPQTPVFQNAVHPTSAAARAAPSGDLAFECCAACGFVWNGAFDPQRINYSAGYDNSQVHSDAFLAHLASRISRILDALPSEGPVTVVEIGCGQGDFLGRLRAAVPTGREFRAVGFDPAYRGGASVIHGVEFHAVYFGREQSQNLGLAPQIVVSRHTIEHVPDPVSFLTAIREGLPEGSRARLFLETPDSAWIIENRAYHDFFYEHCSLFGFRSMATALARAGWQPRAIETCFAGQYLWVEAEPASLTMREGIEGFVDGASEYVARWRQLVQDARSKGSVVLWGAGAKGATFALMIDTGAVSIDAVIDSNPGKSGAFVAVTAHPILPPEALTGRDVRTVVIMNPNYESEIRAKLAALGLAPDVLVLR